MCLLNSCFTYSQHYNRPNDVLRETDHDVSKTCVFFYLNTVTSNWVKKVFQSFFPNLKRLNLANFSNVIITILYFLAFCLPFVESKEEQLETDLNRNKVSRDSKK